ncbi:hypothetical protein ALC53_07124 [Atta colombica]|uniref:Uncharacterized protein n=1 Tax=Atta colombica TaxID=520822 RepID=A0A195BCP4_9HYME|nr:hypothetical protein ALC53_07124 [Atta colombica]
MSDCFRIKRSPGRVTEIRRIPTGNADVTRRTAPNTNPDNAAIRRRQQWQEEEKTKRETSRWLRRGRNSARITDYCVTMALGTTPELPWLSSGMCATLSPGCRIVATRGLVANEEADAADSRSQSDKCIPIESGLPVRYYTAANNKFTSITWFHLRLANDSEIQYGLFSSVKGTQSGTFGSSKQPLNPRRIRPRDFLNDVAGCIHTSQRQVA